MKKVLSILTIAAVSVAACNNPDTKATGHGNHDNGQTSSEASKQAEDAKTIQPTFAHLDAAVSSHVKNLFDHYLHVKTALVNSNAAEAKEGANALLQVLKNFDRSGLPAEQKEAYDQSITGIRLAAEGIAGTGDVARQREQFARLSTSAYELAKSFGAGKTLYHDHCPMAFNEKGAMWLSEQKEIRNPYYGEEMPECGTVEEVIQKP